MRRYKQIQDDVGIGGSRFNLASHENAEKQHVRVGNRTKWVDAWIQEHVQLECLSNFTSSP